MKKLNIKKSAADLGKTLILPVAVYLLFFILSRALGTGKFGLPASTKIILQQAMVSTCIAWAMSLNMMSGRWDFSMGAIVILTSILAAPVARVLDIGGVGLLLASLVIAVCLSTINGVLYNLMRLPSLVLSIGLLLIYEFCMVVLFGGVGAKASGAAMTIFGRSPYVFILGLVMALIFYLAYSHSLFGYEVRSLAYGQQIAVNIGVNEKKSAVLCYAFCGLFLGAAATINLSVSGGIESNPSFNNDMGIMFDAFPAVFIGMYLRKYTNFTFGLFIGALTMKLLTAGILTLSLPSSMQNIGTGLFLLLFITFSTNQTKIYEARARRRRGEEILARQRQ